MSIWSMDSEDIFTSGTYMNNKSYDIIFLEQGDDTYQIFGNNIAYFTILSKNGDKYDVLLTTKAGANIVGSLADLTQLYGLIEHDSSGKEVGVYTSLSE